MKAKLLDNTQIIWEHLVETHKAFSLASREFLALEKSRRTELMHNALRGKDRNTAIVILNHLDRDDLMALFDDLVFLASFSHGAIGVIRKVILSLPHEWVLANIRGVTESSLKTGSHEEYRRFLELYIELDHTLAYELAQRALEQSDEDIKEAGRDFLDKLNR